MKKFLYYLFFILLSYNVIALIGGNNVSLFNIDNCYDKIYINVSGQYNIEQGEYSLINCIEIYNNSWECNCSEIFLFTEINTLNNYTFNFSYTQKFITETGGGSGSYHNIVKYPIYTKNETSIPNIISTITTTNNIITTTTKQDNLVTTTTQLIIDIPKINTSNNEQINTSTNFNFKKLILIIVGIVLLLVLIYIIYINKTKTNISDSEKDEILKNIDKNE